MDLVNSTLGRYPALSLSTSVRSIIVLLLSFLPFTAFTGTARRTNELTNDHDRYKVSSFLSLNSHHFKLGGFPNRAWAIFDYDFVSKHSVAFRIISKLEFPKLEFPKLTKSLFASSPSGGKTNIVWRSLVIG